MKAVLLAAVVVAQAAAPATMVDVGGHKLNVRVAGTARPGVPAVIFESGLGSPVNTWGAVPSEIGATTRTVVYDRAGIGASEPGPVPRSVKQIVAELHALLAKIDVPPPYVLVGHSYGGPLIHSFAATYPKEVAGLVYVDPTDFTQTDADIQAIWEKVGVKDGRESLRTAQAQALASATPGVKAEALEVERMERAGFADLRAAGDPPDLPTVILLAGKRQPLPATLAFPGGNYDGFFQLLLDQRRDHFGKLAERATKGTLVETSKSSHFIHLTEPETLVWAVQRVMSASSTRSDLDRFVGEYPLSPAFKITITRDGDKLFAQATGQQAFPLYPDSATTFSLRVVDATVEFQVDAAGAVTGLVLAQNGQRLRAAKSP
jgi:pimeloyl-ACP methyl ester carboxylesterase